MGDKVGSDDIAQDKVGEHAFEKGSDLHFRFVISVVMCGLWKDPWLWDKKDLSFNFTSPTYESVFLGKLLHLWDPLFPDL